jgi:general secretion pathway protein I
LSRVKVRERRKNCAGFTIIEVLVALAVVAASLAAIGSVIATSTRGVRSLEQRIALLQTARAVETGLPRRSQLAVGRLEGEIDGHRWRIDVSPFAAAGRVDDSPWVPQSIVIQVRSPSGAVLQLDTVRLFRRPNG